MVPKITRDILDSFLHCKLKARLKLIGEQGVKCDYDTLLAEMRANVRLAAINQTPARRPAEPIPRSIPLTTDALKQGAPLILESTLEDDHFCLRFDALRRVDGPSMLGDFHYVPVLFSEWSKVGKHQRSLLELYGHGRADGPHQKLHRRSRRRRECPCRHRSAGETADGGLETLRLGGLAIHRGTLDTE